MLHRSRPVSILLSAGLAAAMSSAPRAQSLPPPGGGALSPAALQIEAARARIDTGSAGAGDYVDLATGLTRRARETGDSDLYDRALEAVAAALRLEPGNAGAQRAAAWARMGRHEFAAALAIARRHVAAHPHDTPALGVLADALMELGQYDEAAPVLQRMIDQRPGPASYSRAAYLRELRGDLDGASDLMRMSLDATGPRDREDRAWLLTQLGHLDELRGDGEAARRGYEAALAEFPGYHYALAAQAALALRAGRWAEALDLAARAVGAAPHAERYLILADALRAHGRAAEARAAEDRFEALALGNLDRADNENHDLVLFYLERRVDVPRALAIARQEAGRRRDIHTLDRLALALRASGREARARRLMRTILATGTRDPLILAHAAAFGPAGGR